MVNGTAQKTPKRKANEYVIASTRNEEFERGNESNTKQNDYVRTMLISNRFGWNESLCIIKKQKTWSRCQSVQHRNMIVSHSHVEYVREMPWDVNCNVTMCGTNTSNKSKTKNWTEVTIQSDAIQTNVWLIHSFAHIHTTISSLFPCSMNIRPSDVERVLNADLSVFVWFSPFRCHRHFIAIIFIWVLVLNGRRFQSVQTKANRLQLWFCSKMPKWIDAILKRRLITEFSLCLIRCSSPCYSIQLTDDQNWSDHSDEWSGKSWWWNPFFHISWIELMKA